MFCYQCQETASGKGCTIKGVCGKDPLLAQWMDLLLYITKGLSQTNQPLREKGLNRPETDHFVLDALFCTITNANFDEEAIASRIEKGIALKNDLLEQLKKHGLVIPTTPEAQCNIPREEYSALAETVGVLSESNEDIRSLKELIVYGLKGMAAYAHHALNLGFEDADIHRFIQFALIQTTRKDIPMEELIPLVLQTGEYGVKTMALLDKANTTRYGNPEMTEVKLGVGKNPGILISGHDLKDLEELLEQTEGKGVDIYTHSEMLPAHYYPYFKKYKHFFGNYGNAWWKQRDEFETFHGVFLFTTNCIVPPTSKSTYKDRIYTTGSSGLKGAIHIADRTPGGQKDFSRLIAHAQQCPPPEAIEEGTLTGGFAHHQVTLLADQIVDAVKSGAIRKFYVMGGCDGRMKSRDYYTEFAKGLRDDTVILTAGCAKYRYNKLKLNPIGGIPRVLDAGQCNDSYSLAIIALKLKEIFELEDINQLPIVYNIAWYEQKAIIVLLALLFLGVKNIHAGPTLPAFLSPNVLKVLVENFNLSTISTVEEDLKAMY